MSHIRSAQNSPGTWAAISRCQRAQNVSAGSDSRHAACTLHPRCFPSPAACGYYCPHVRATLGWYELIQQPFSGLSRYRHPTIFVGPIILEFRTPKPGGTIPSSQASLHWNLLHPAHPWTTSARPLLPSPAAQLPYSHNARLAAGLGGPEVLLHYTWWQGMTQVVLAADAVFHVGTVGSWWRGTQDTLAGVQRGQPQP